MLASMLAVATVGIVLFALPLGVAIGRLYKGREVTRLEREAIRAVGALPDKGLRGADPIRVPRTPQGITLAYYDRSARLVAGTGTSHGGREVMAALAGRESEAAGSSLVVAVPIHDEESVVGVAQATESMSGVHTHTYATWVAMIGVGLMALAIAALFARRQARRLAVPIGDIEALAIRLGEGEFSARIDPHDVPELARAADALNQTAIRLGDLLTRERAFTADVSHQLATPLTGLRLGLESALLTPGIDQRTAIADAVAEVERLQRTVTTLLALARDVPVKPTVCNAGDCCTEVAERHRAGLRAADREIHVDIDRALPEARCSADALREILEVLVDNAEQHGAGTVTVRARIVGPGIVLDVEDEGTGIAFDPEALFVRRSTHAAGHGIGLALARAVADAHGARLLLTRAAPRPIFSIMLSGAEPSDAPPADADGNAAAETEPVAGATPETGPEAAPESAKVKLG